MANVDPTALTAQSLITAGLRKTGDYARGEAIDAAVLSDALDTLNSLLDTLSNDNKAIFSSNENVVILTAGQKSYSVGNEYAGVFVGTVTSGSSVITGVTIPQVGTNGSANSVISIGATLLGPGIPTGSTVTAIGTNTVTMSSNAVGTFTNQISFTSPGQIVIQRPLKITKAYSRLTYSGSTVDFPCESKDLDAYGSIGLKSQPGPWAKMLFYNPSFPNGQIYFWPVPSQNVEFHFWTDSLLQSLQLNSVLTLPQGYYLWLQFLFAEIWCIENGIQISDDIKRLIRKYEAMIKSNNAVVDQLARIDGAITSTGGNDAAFILTGGF